MSFLTSVYLDRAKQQTGEEKIKTLVEAIKSDLYPLEGYTELGKYLTELGDYEKAKVCLDRAKQVVFELLNETEIPEELKQACQQLDNKTKKEVYK
jgi:tetratricopeptide (TPR) repeat protein